MPDPSLLCLNPEPGASQGRVEVRALGQRSGGNLRESQPSVQRSSCPLSSSLPSSLPRKIPARKLGVCRGLCVAEGAAPFLQPPSSRFPPPARGSSQAELARLDRCPDWGTVCRGPTEGLTARHGLQQRRKENSERPSDPEIINVRAGRSLPCHRPASSYRRAVSRSLEVGGPGREGDWAWSLRRGGGRTEVASDPGSWALLCGHPGAMTGRQGQGPPLQGEAEGQLGRALRSSSVPSVCPSLEARCWSWALTQAGAICRPPLGWAPLEPSWGTRRLDSESPSVDLE